MKIERYEDTGRMSRAVVAGETIYLCGQTDKNTPGIKAQTASVLARVEALLERYGSDKRHILSVTIYLKDMVDFDAMNEVWDAWVVPGHTPARACVHADTGVDEILLEVMVTAAVR